LPCIFLCEGKIFQLLGDFNPVFFLECVAEWMLSGDKSVRIDFYGNCDIDYDGWLKDLNLDEIVTFHGFKPRSELLPLLRQADLFLLLLSFQKQHRHVIPAKLFEYLACGAPVLALAPQGVTSEMIEKHNAGACLSEPNRDMMVQLLERFYQEWKDNPRRDRKYRYIKQIDRSQLTGQLAKLLDSATQSQ